MNNLITYLEQANESARCAEQVAEAVSELSCIQKVQVFNELTRLNALKDVGRFGRRDYN